MDVLYQLVRNLSKEQLRQLKLRMQRYNRKGERRDLQLLDILRDEGITDPAEQARAIGCKRNALYRLRKRLQEEILQIQLEKLYVAEDESTLLLRLEVADALAQQGQPRVAHQLAQKILQRVEHSDAFQVVERACSLLIQLAKFPETGIDPEPYIARRKENEVFLQQLRSLEDIGALLTHRLQKTGGREQPADWLATVEQTVAQAEAANERIRYPKFQIQLYELISKLLVNQQRYAELAKYVEETYTRFEAEGMFQHAPEDLPPRMLTFWANALYECQRHNESLQVTRKLGLWLDAAPEHLRKKYHFFHLNSRIINYSEIDPAKAIKMLLQLSRNRSFLENSFYSVYVFSNLAILYFNKDDYSNAVRSLTRLYVDANFGSLDTAMRIRLKVFEFILRIELQQFDFLRRKLRAFQKEYLQELPAQPAEALMLQALQHLVTHDGQLSEKASRDHLRQLGQQLQQQEEAGNQGIVDYSAWLSRFA